MQNFDLTERFFIAGFVLLILFGFVAFGASLEEAFTAPSCKNGSSPYDYEFIGSKDIMIGKIDHLTRAYIVWCDK